jgi:hypothetical protein
MNNFQARQSGVRGVAVATDSDGNPKLSREATIKFWKMLGKQDRRYLKNKYSLDLEV